jgi:general secretion pathway protein B
MAKTKASARPEATRKREESRDGAQEPVAVPREPPRPVEPVPPKRDKVPEDLRQEIEAFKDSLRNKDNKPPRKAEAPAAEVPPQELRLPKDVAARLPTLIMTVHIHDENPAKRFVLINGRKIREGKSTRDGVTVEEILPDGAVLSYDGHKFFRHR